MTLIRDDASTKPFLIVLAFLLGWPAGIASAGSALPFLDEFDDDVTATGRQPVQWFTSSINGTLASDGDNLILENTGGDIGAWVFEVSNSNPDRVFEYGDVSVRSQLRMLEPGNGTSFASLMVKAATSTAGGIYWGGIQRNGQLSIGLTTNNGSNIITRDSLNTSLDPIARDVVLQLDAIGDTITLSGFEVGDSTPAGTISFADTNYTAGTIGMFINGSSGATRRVAFRYFEAVPEPTSGLLLLVGSLAALRRYRQ